MASKKTSLLDRLSKELASYQGNPETFRRVAGLLVWQWCFDHKKTLDDLATLVGCSPAWLRKALSRGVARKTKSNTLWLAKLANLLKIGIEDFWCEDTAVIVVKPGLQCREEQRMIEAKSDDCCGKLNCVRTPERMRSSA